MTISRCIPYNSFCHLAKNKMKYLLSLLVVLVTSDGLLTNFLLRDGLVREGNPFLQTIVGDTGFLILKVVGALLCALILWDIHKRYPKLAIISTSCFVVFYAAIVLWNSSILVRA